MYGLNKEELKILKKLKTPKKIQDFINSLIVNFDEDGETFMSPRMVLRKKKCHCIEGAILAALALRLHGYKPLVIDLTTTRNDFDHVIAVFKKNGFWGCISKSNHYCLRYREPVYRDIRELVMSIFHEYLDERARKSLRSYSEPVDLSLFDKKGWVTSEKNLWYIYNHLRKVKHYKILNRKQIADLRKADKIEDKVGSVVEYKQKKYKNQKDFCLIKN